MIDSEAGKFAELIGNVYAFYRQDSSDFAVGVWWQAMRPFDFAAVADALNRHCVNPDSGQFMPKPADVVKMLQGTTKDGAMVAWSKVDKAVRQVGTYASVVFDDPVIHCVLRDMGGWVQLGTKEEKEWPFIAKEFENRYRAYKLRSDAADFPPMLAGIAESQNAQNGMRSQPPVLIGNPEQAKQVLRLGAKKQAPAFTRLDAASPLQLESAEVAR